MQDAYLLKSRESWYQTRTIAMINAKSAGAKIPSDFMQFPWEAAEKEEDIDANALAELRARVKQINSKNNG